MTETELEILKCIKRLTEQQEVITNNLLAILLPLNKQLFSLEETANILGNMAVKDVKKMYEDRTLQGCVRYNRKQIFRSSIINYISKLENGKDLLYHINEQNIYKNIRPSADSLNNITGGE